MKDWIKELCPEIADWQAELIAEHCPPKREWQGLTDEERMELAIKTGAMTADWLPFMEAVEKKLKEKNEERI